MNQKEMKDVLHAEGFQITQWELSRVRSKFNLLLREGRKKEGGGAKKKTKKVAEKGAKKDVVRLGRGLIDQLAAAILQESESSEDDSLEEDDDDDEQEQPENEATAAQPEPPAPVEPLDPAEAQRRQLRRQQFVAESDEKLRARKRRRRTKGWAGLPADAPGQPPRFPSETTLDEAKAYLSLDNKLYNQIRDEFQTICREQKVVKKTVAGVEKWAEMLQQLVRENHHLRSTFQEHPEIFHQPGELWKPKNYKTLALDVMCQDVTKRIRHMERPTRMSMVEARNALHLNPAQAREVKRAFHDILKADHFTNKFESGPEHWNELKQRWVQGSKLLGDAISSSAGEDERAKRARAIEVLGRDVMKRLRAATTRREREEGVRAEKEVHHGPGPGRASMLSLNQTQRPHRGDSGSSNDDDDNGTPNSPSRPKETSQQNTYADADLQIDPSLLLAAASSAHHQAQAYNLDYHTNPQAPNTTTITNTTTPSLPTPFTRPQSTPSPAPLPIYFRLDPRSATPFPYKTVWLSVLQTHHSVAAVRSLATREHPNTMVLGLEGVLKTHAGEASISIDDDDELAAYLEHVQAGSGKVTIVVLLGGGGVGYV